MVQVITLPQQIAAKVWWEDTYSRDRLIERVEQVTCEVMELAGTEILFRRTRKRGVVVARQCVTWIVYLHSGWSFKELAERYGGMDHSTAIHSCHMVADAVDSQDPYIYPALRKIMKHFPNLKQFKFHQTYRKIPIDYDSE